MTYPAPEVVPYDEWFDPNYKYNPLDSMPIATDDDPIDTSPSEIQPPGVDQEEDITIHEKMYRIATSRYNPFSVGGSENCHSDIDCNIGGSEEIQK